MRKNGLLVLFVITFYHFCYSQEFSFSMYFEDAAGHKDTLVIGYDPVATATIDTAFGEVNILNEPLDTFDVRISDELIQRLLSDTATFHLKNRLYIGNVKIGIHYLL